MGENQVIENAYEFKQEMRMYNHITKELGAASRALAIRRHLLGLLAAWADYSVRKAGEQRLHELDAHLLNDIGEQGIVSRPSTLAAQNPHVVAMSLQLLRLP